MTSTLNVFGTTIGGGMNSNGIVQTLTNDEIDKGGYQPLSAINLNNSTGSGSGANFTIYINKASLCGGGGISSVLANKLRDILANYVDPFVIDDISGTVNANINSTMYFTDISGIYNAGNIDGITDSNNNAGWTDEQLIASFALSTIGVINRGLLLYLDNEDLKVQVAVIADQIRNEMAPKLMSQQAGIMINISTSATIDLRYVFYVEKYGPPIGGIFDPMKLAEFV
jgi:hypothetical protein